MIFYKLWYTSAPPYNAYLKELKPVGRIMNSYIANKFPACLPPLMTFKQGTGVKNFSPLCLPEKSAKYL